MHRLPLLARISVGLLLLVFGLDYFLSFMPETASSPRGTAFLEALLATGYLFPLIKIVEIACGIAFLSGRFVPLALLMMAPIALNIALYHAVLDHNGAIFGFALVALEIYLAFAYRAHWKPVLDPGLRDVELPKPRRLDLSPMDAV